MGWVFFYHTWQQSVSIWCSLIGLYNTRIQFNNIHIVIMDNDVKGAFRHCKYHPDIVSVFAFITQHLLYIPLDNTFGSIVSPSNFEPIGRARTHLAGYLSNKYDLTNKYKHISSTTSNSLTNQQKILNLYVLSQINLIKALKILTKQNTLCL